MAFPLLAAASLGLQGLGMIQGNREAKKARKEQERINQENKKQEAFNNVINLLMGGQARNTPQQALPQVGMGNLLTGLGGLAGSASNMMTNQSNSEAARIQKDIDRQEQIRQFNTREANDISIAGTRGGNTAQSPWFIPDYTE